ncbi:MAG: hypothetical protein LC099_07560 [Anaerolineales bacterium]|nr:hypothetical protein [Anaerolineales bacterium]
MLPRISVNELNEKLKSDEEFILLDVRELDELNFAKIQDRRLEVAPLSRLAAEGLSALPEAARQGNLALYVLCHHGSRSAQTVGWLISQGFKNVFDVGGGIDAYAVQADSSVGRY